MSYNGAVPLNKTGPPAAALEWVESHSPAGGENRLGAGVRMQFVVQFKQKKAGLLFSLLIRLQKTKESLCEKSYSAQHTQFIVELPWRKLFLLR